MINETAVRYFVEIIAKEYGFIFPVEFTNKLCDKYRGQSMNYEELYNSVRSDVLSIINNICNDEW